MENKSLFAAMTLSVALVATVIFYQQTTTQLKTKIKHLNAASVPKDIVLEPCPEVKSTDNIKVSTVPTPQFSTLDEINNQLINTRTLLKQTQQKLLLATSKSQVLEDEMAQMRDVRPKIKTLQNSLKSTQQKLKQANKKMHHFTKMLKSQNKTIAGKNIVRIQELKKTSTGIAVGGLLVPAVGLTILAAHTIEEINNYCANIKNIITTEKKLFGKTISLDKKMLDNYRQQCSVSLKKEPKASSIK